MSRPPSEAALIDALRAGERDAFERLYAEYSGPVYNLCARILGDREEAEDVTQEVFIKALDRLPPADAGPLKLKAWLYRVATNACFNVLRSRRKLDGGGDDLLTQTAAPVDEYQRSETVAVVEASLAEMNGRYRTALVLKDLHGLPPAEIAAVMGVSRPAADVLVHRARGAFKAAFARLGGATPAPADLGLVLAPLSLPPALHAVPPVAHLVPPAQVLPQPDVASAGASSAAGPAGAGLLGKIGASLAAKVAVGGAVTAVVVGGGMAIRNGERGGGAEAGARTGAPTAAPGFVVSEPPHQLKTRWGVLEWDTAHDLHELQDWCADQTAAEHHADADHDAETSGGDEAEHAATTGGSHASDEGSAAEPAHETSSGSSTTPHDSGGGAQASGGGTDSGGSGDSGGHEGGDAGGHGGGEGD